MGIIDTLITDRTAAHVQRLLELEAAGWDKLTAAEQTEYHRGDALEQISDSQGPLYDQGGAPLYAPDGVQRGAYNASDLNRVEEAVGYLAEKMANGALKTYGEGLGVAWDANYDPAWAGADFQPETKTDWATTDFPRASDMERYLGNVAAIRRAVPADYPTLPESMDRLGYAGANAIEQVLEIADGVIDAYTAEMAPVLERVAESFVPCGVTQCGTIW